MKLGSKGPPHGFIILNKFHVDCSKIVNFLLIVNFLSCPDFFQSVSILDKLKRERAVGAI